MRDFVACLLKWAVQGAGVLAIFIALFAAYSCVHTRRSPEPDRVDFTLDGPPIIRVGLSKWTGVLSIPIAIDGPYRVLGPQGDLVAAGEKLPELEVVATPTGLRAGETDLAVWDATFQAEGDSGITVGERKYRGAIRIWSVGGGRVSASSEVDLETYLGGVVGSEMNASWPASALMAQAIAARTYAVYEMRKARVAGGRKDGVDVWDDERSQVYAGKETETPKLIELVGKTRGAIMTYDGRILHAFYSSTCGGRTEAAKEELGGPDIAPLAGRSCEFCEGTKYYTWTVEMTGRELASKLHPGLPPTTAVKEMRVEERTPAGHAKTVVYKLGDAARETRIKASDLRRALGGRVIRSTWFDVVQNADSIRIEGRGFGHGVGMCQMGAKEMGERGYDATEILRYYYPSADLVRIY